jgi:hypothetical protein
MKRYRVIVTRDATCSTSVDLKARSRRDALDRAQAEAREFPERFEWTLDEGSLGGAYLGDSSLNAAERVTA